jgi:hypothetical protein
MAMREKLSMATPAPHWKVIEVTGLRWAGQLWWSFGFEAFSQYDSERNNLLRAVEYFF